MKWKSIERAVSKYLNEIKYGRTNNTIQTIKKNLNRILVNFDDDPTNITFNHYYQALEQLKQQYKSSTVNKTHLNASKFLKWMNHKDAKQISNIRVPIYWDKIETYSMNEINSILSWCFNQKETLWRLRLAAFLLIISSSGMRGGECQRLKWSDLDFDQNLFHIKKTKTGYSRFAAVHPKIIPYLINYREKISKLINYYSEYIFPSFINPANFISYNALTTKMNNEVSSELGFHVNCKKFRSTMVKLIVESGGGYEKAASIVGHKNIGVTQKHYHRITMNKSALEAYDLALKDFRFS